MTEDINVAELMKLVAFLERSRDYALQEKEMIPENEGKTRRQYAASIYGIIAHVVKQISTNPYYVDNLKQPYILNFKDEFTPSADVVEEYRSKGLIINR
jgi:hypothetical protein